MPTIIDVTGIQNALIGTTDISDIGDGTITSALDKHNENFAVEETSPTTAAHVIGEYIVWKGTLYSVKTAISAGATLEVGRNIVQKTVATMGSVLVVFKSSVSSLPTTISNSNITTNHVVVNSVLSNPSAQTGDWTVTTAAGALTISGSISGTTNITLYLALQR